MDPDRQVAGGFQSVGRFKDQEGNPARLIFSVRIRAADLIVVRIVQQQTCDIVDGIFVVDAPGGNVALVIGAEYLVKLPSRTVAVVGAGSHIEPCDPLAGLAQGFRRIVLQPEVDAPQFSLCRHGGTVNPVADSGKRLQFSVQQFDRFGVEFMRFERPFHLARQSAPAEGQPDPVIRREVGILADAVGQVVKLLVVMQKRIVHRKRRKGKLIPGAHA